MKNLYLNILALLICAFGANAQLTLTKALYEPVAGDLDKRMGYDSTTAIPKNTGTNQVWNFTSLITTTATGSYTTAYTSPVGVPNASLFPLANLACSSGGTNYEFYRSNGANYEYLGNSDLSSPETMVFSNTGIVRVWPISYGSSSTDSWAAFQTSSSGTMSMAGSVTVAATGTGTVILPNGNVHPNCLQVRETVTMTATTGTLVMTGYFVDTYYYEAGTKHPIMRIDYETMGGLKLNASANTDALLAGVTETRNFNKAVSIYPNPVKDELYISLNGSETPIALQVMDMAGRDVISREFSNSINVESLEQGLYIVKLNYKDKVLYQRFVKTN